MRAHLHAAHELLAQDAPIGRRFDFLAQEFNRESNTVCSKSNAASLTAIGLQLRSSSTSCANRFRTSNETSGRHRVPHPDRQARAHARHFVAVGAGKSTIARSLLEQDTRFSLSVSVTTRTRRPSEIDGVHYHFISRDEFFRLRDGDALLEWPRSTAISTEPRARPPRGDAGRARHVVRHRLAGRASAAGKGEGRHRVDLHPAAVDGRVEVAPSASRRRLERDDRHAPAQREGRDRAVAGLRICRDQRRSQPCLLRRAVDRQRRASAPGPAPGLFDFTSVLLEQASADIGKLDGI